MSEALREYATELAELLLAEEGRDVGAVPPATTGPGIDAPGTIFVGTVNASYLVCGKSQALTIDNTTVPPALLVNGIAPVTSVTPIAASTSMIVFQSGQIGPTTAGAPTAVIPNVTNLGRSLTTTGPTSCGVGTPVVIATMSTVAGQSYQFSALVTSSSALISALSTYTLTGISNAAGGGAVMTASSASGAPRTDGTITATSLSVLELGNLSSAFNNIVTGWFVASGASVTLSYTANNNAQTVTASVNLNA